MSRDISGASVCRENLEYWIVTVVTLRSAAPPFFGPPRSPPDATRGEDLRELHKLFLTLLVASSVTSSVTLRDVEVISRDVEATSTNVEVTSLND